MRSVDPRRLVNVNHCPQDADTGKPYWYNSGEDWPWCSIFVALNGNLNYARGIKTNPVIVTQFTKQSKELSFATTDFNNRFSKSKKISNYLYDYFIQK